MSGYATSSQSGLRGRRLPRQSGITLMELLVSMTILAVITTLILTTWFSLQKSYAFSVNGSHAREAARDAVAGMTIAIRDAQDANFSYPFLPPPNAISVAESSKIVINTSYQQATNANIAVGSGLNSNAVVQACYIYEPSANAVDDGSIFYVVDKNNNGLTDELASLATIKQHGHVVCDHVVNSSRPSTSNPTSVFTYTYFGDDGAIHQVTSMTPQDIINFGIYSVQIHVLIDLDPAHAPIYMDLQSTSQPRNMRPST